MDSEWWNTVLSGCGNLSATVENFPKDFPVPRGQLRGMLRFFVGQRLFSLMNVTMGFVTDYAPIPTGMLTRRFSPSFSRRSPQARAISGITFRE